MPLYGTDLPPPPALRTTQTPPSWASQVCFRLGKTMSEQTAQTSCLSFFSGKHNAVSCLNSPFVYCMPGIPVYILPALSDLTRELVPAQVVFYSVENSPATFSFRFTIQSSHDECVQCVALCRGFYLIFPNVVSIESVKEWRGEKIRMKGQNEAR